MTTVTIDEERLKDLLKSAMIEALEEHRDVLQNIMEEVLEDIGLAHAIEQGLSSKSISRDEVSAILEGSDK